VKKMVFFLDFDADICWCWFRFWWLIFSWVSVGFYMPTPKQTVDGLHLLAYIMYFSRIANVNPKKFFTSCDPHCIFSTFEQQFALTTRDWGAKTEKKKEQWKSFTEIRLDHHIFPKTWFGKIMDLATTKSEDSRFHDFMCRTRR
jgi:hypothetical protein